MRGKNGDHGGYDDDADDEDDYDNEGVNYNLLKSADIDTAVPPTTRQPLLQYFFRYAELQALMQAISITLCLNNPIMI